MRQEGFVEAEIDGEVVALSIERGLCYGLNHVGTRVWKLLQTPINVGGICATLLLEYDVDPEECEEQVIDLLQDLHAEGLVARVEER